MIFIQVLEPIVQKHLDEHNYHAVRGFIKFYQAYQKNRDVPFEDPITAEHYTSVELAMDLLNKIQTNLHPAYPDIVTKLFIASCEGEYDGDYTKNSPPPLYFVFKEHIMLGLNINVNGRSGRIILEPGYQASKAVVVMKDRKYPHTGRRRSG